MTTPAHEELRRIAEASNLEVLRTFIECEIESRGSAGSDMSDYQDEAEQALEALEALVAFAAQDKARIEELEGFARFVLAADREALADHRPKWGLANCVDNNGVPYQSQAFGDALSRVSSILHGGNHDQ